MREIGIREAKARLNYVLHDVQVGGEWMITHHGKPVARIVPVDTASLTLSQRLRILEDRGVIEPPGEDAHMDMTPPLPVPEGLEQRLLQEDRNGGSWVRTVPGHSCGAVAAVRGQPQQPGHL